MKTYQRITAGVLALGMMFAAVPAFGAEFAEAVLTANAEEGLSGRCGENATWTLDSETGTLTISGTGAVITGSEFWRYNFWRFESELLLNADPLEDTLTYYQSSYTGSTSSYDKWNGNAVKKIVIEDGITSIEENAFCSMPALTSVSMPDSLEVIGSCAFAGCMKLSTINFSKNLKVIGTSAFMNCSSLKSVTLPDSLEEVYSCAFTGTSLTEVTLPASVKMCSLEAFYNCQTLEAIHVAEDNPNFCDVDGILYSKDKTILRQIPYNAPITSYTVPAGVETITKYALDCQNLKKVSLPASLSYLSSWAFSTSLESVTVNKNNPYCCSVSGVLYSKDKKSLLHYPASRPDETYSVLEGTESFVIPVVGATQDTYKFKYLKKLFLPASLENINKIFAASLKSIEYIDVDPENKTYLSADGALYKGTELVYFPEVIKEHTIPDGITTFDLSTPGTSSNIALEKLTIPASVTSFRLSGCEALESITFLTKETDESKLREYSWFAYEEEGAGYSGVIYGYAGTVSEKVAESKFCNFIPLEDVPEVSGDADGDGKVTVSDAVTLQKALFAKKGTKLPKAVDLNGDGAVNVFDLALLKRQLIQK